MVWEGKKEKVGEGWKKCDGVKKREETVLEHVRKEDQDGGGERMNQEHERGKEEEKQEREEMR